MTLNKKLLFCYQTGMLGDVRNTWLLFAPDMKGSGTNSFTYLCHYSKQGGVIKCPFIRECFLQLYVNRTGL